MSTVRKTEERTGRICAEPDFRVRTLVAWGGKRRNPGQFPDILA